MIDTNFFVGMIPIILAVVLGGICVYIMILNKRSHRLRLRDPTNARAYVRDYWAIEKKDKDSGVLYWRSVWGKRVFNTPAPPPKAIEIGLKGKKFAEAYKVSEDEFIWITDKGLKWETRISKTTGTEKKVLVDIQEDGTYKTIDSFQPFSAVQREMIVNQYRKAQETRNKSWGADKIVAMTSIMGFVIILVCLFIFWGDLAQPLLTMSGQMDAREQRLIKLEKELCMASSGQTIQTGQNTASNVIIQKGTDQPLKNG